MHVIYDEATGRIQSTIATPLPQEGQGVAFHAAVRLEGGANAWWFDGEKIAPRPVARLKLSKDRIAADGKDKAVLSGLPKPARVYVNREEFTVEDGRIEFVSQHPGIADIVVSTWPFMEQRFTIAIGGNE